MKHDDTTLQAAIDAAMNGRAFIACPEIYPKGWTNESPARLALAKAFLAKLPEAQSILADDGRSLGQVAWEAGNEIQKRKFPNQEILSWEQGEELHEQLEAAAKAVAAVVLDQAIRRMEAVPVEELMPSLYEIETSQDEAEQIRARLIAAARGEAEQQPDSTETPAPTATEAADPYEELKAAQAAGKTIEVFVKDDEYGPDRWSKKENNSWTLPVEYYRICKTPVTEPADPYARLKAYAKAGARIRCGHDSVWRVGQVWNYIVDVSKYEVHPDDLHMVPEYAPVNEPPMQQVPLGPEDVMPGSVIRGRNWALDWGKCWLAVLETTPTGVHCNRGDEYRFTSLQYDWQINRSIPLTGRWDENAWEPCYKLI